MLIRHLLPEEKQIIEEEINNNLLKFRNHTRINTSALRYGKTIYLTDGTTFIAEGYFPKTITLLKDVAANLASETFGRVYIHRLQPGEFIVRHADTAELYFFDILRYHIYLDIPDDVKILHSGDTIAPNSIILFNHQKLHEYINNSDKNIFFLVFDLYK